jgi:hypothetical protein
MSRQGRTWASVLAIATLAGCGANPPSCTAPETLRLTKELIAEDLREEAEKDLRAFDTMGQSAIIGLVIAGTPGKLREGATRGLGGPEPCGSWRLRGKTIGAGFRRGVQWIRIQKWDDALRWNDLSTKPERRIVYPTKRVQNTGSRRSERKIPSDHSAVLKTAEEAAAGHGGLGRYEGKSATQWRRQRQRKRRGNGDTRGTHTYEERNAGIKRRERPEWRCSARIASSQ